MPQHKSWAFRIHSPGHLKYFVDHVLPGPIADAIRKQLPTLELPTKVFEYYTAPKADIVEVRNATGDEGYILIIPDPDTALVPFAKGLTRRGPKYGDFLGGHNMTFWHGPVQYPSHSVDVVDHLVKVGFRKSDLTMVDADLAQFDDMAASSVAEHALACEKIFATTST